MNFYSMLTKLCHSKGLSITKLCEEIGLSNATGTHWKNGAKPSAKTLKKIADYFEMSERDFLSTLYTIEWIDAVKTMQQEANEYWQNKPNYQKTLEHINELTVAYAKAPQNIKKAINELLEIEIEINIEDIT